MLFFNHPNPNFKTEIIFFPMIYNHAILSKVFIISGFKLKLKVKAGEDNRYSITKLVIGTQN